MLNMLRMDLRRMFRSRMFYIAFLCLTAGILIMIIMLHTITDPELREQAIDAGMKFTTTNDSDFDEIRQMSETEALCSTIYSGGFFFVALYVVAVLFICSDFSSGFAKNIGSMLVFRVICRICGMYFAPDEPGVYAAFFLGYLLIGAAYMAQGLFLSVMFRSEGAGIAAAIVVPGGILIVMVESMLGNWGLSINDMTLYGCVQNMTGYLVQGDSFMKGAAVAGVWLVIWSAASLWPLYKKDI
ncbi:MAG: hypothetical protein KH237_09845 [Clostridium sp.]|nr:hypothetical protein [Clostridium sp.]